MKKTVKISIAFLIVMMIVSMSACNKADKNYGVESSTVADSVTSTESVDDGISRPAIMSSDRVMSKYVDISLFDEENYSSVYLGKKFKFNVTYDADKLSVPATYNALEKKGWKMLENSQYNKESLLYACDSVDAVFENEDGAKISAVFFNSSNSSVKLKKCNIVKFRIENEFYSDSAEKYEFNVNGINNKMAITDIIDTLGTPSHFYAVSQDSYYLDYFISEDDRRNGITVYINPIEDNVTAIEFSYYK